MVTPTITRARMVEDAVEMVAWLRREFGKERIFVLGHSWGSTLGLEVAQRHPEWLHAYIGAGQATDGPEGERRGLRFALDAARRDGNVQAVRELEALGDYAAPLALGPIGGLAGADIGVQPFRMALRHLESERAAP